MTPLEDTDPPFTSRPPFLPAFEPALLFQFAPLGTARAPIGNRNIFHTQRLNIAFGVDIFIVGDHDNIRFWKNGSGFDAAGLDYLIKPHKEYYARRQRESTLKKGDRVALLGRGIAVVEQTDDKEAEVVWNRHVLRITRKDIALNQQNMRWECEALSEEYSCASLYTPEFLHATGKTPKCS